MELDFASYIDEYSTYYEVYSNLINVAFKFLGLKCNPIISVTFVDKSTIHEINKTYRHVDRETDVISFAFLDGEPNKKKILKAKNDVVLGDVYICIDVAKEHAKEYGHSEERELKFLFVHGLLHLLGYDHMTKEDEQIMFPLQEEILKREQ